MRPLRWVWH